MTTGFVIFASHDAAYSRPSIVADDEPVASASAPMQRDALAFDAVLEILRAGPRFGEAISEAFRRKEGELLALFRTLSAGQACALHARLTGSDDQDELEKTFARLSEDRRDRLLGALRQLARSAASKGGRR